MAVDVQSKGGCGVAQVLLHGLDVVATFDGQRGIGVLQVVETGGDCPLLPLWRPYLAGGQRRAGTVSPVPRLRYDAHYTTCVRCSRVIHLDDAYYDDDDDPVCPSCYEQMYHDRTIQDYCYKPDPIFYGDGPRFFGVELEIDGGGEYSDNAQKILELANARRPHAYCKHDGSLDDGFEIVTHPMSLDYHMNDMPWQQVVNKAVSLGYSSQQAGTCGLHVHVSRDALGDTYEEQEAVIARILYFVEKHWEELLKFSRRTPRQLERWAARYGYKDQPKEILDHAKKSGHGGRYSSVNLENYNTIEFRIFRGTLKYNTLIATLQMVNRICDVAICLSDAELKAMSWTTFVAGCTEPELVQYLKERRLYVNDPVDDEGGDS